MPKKDEKEKDNSPKHQKNKNRRRRNKKITTNGSDSNNDSDMDENKIGTEEKLDERNSSSGISALWWIKNNLLLPADPDTKHYDDIYNTEKELLSESSTTSQLTISSNAFS